MSPVLLEPPPGPLARVGMVARWRPVHRIHAAILHEGLPAWEDAGYAVEPGAAP